MGSEDYRWEIIKKYIGGAPFFLLNLVFISSLQIVSPYGNAANYASRLTGVFKILLLAVATPTYILLLVSRIHPKMEIADAVFSRTLMALVVFEYFADQQQWKFHHAKQSYQATAKVPQGWTRAQMDRGFVTTGLWRWSRHPNFAAEQTIWVVLYAWACYQTSTYYNWTCAGMIAYLLVFQGSTPITEWVSSSKYPEYKLYQERVGRFLPSFGKGWDEEEMKELAPKAVKEKSNKSGGTKKK